MQLPTPRIRHETHMQIRTLNICGSYCKSRLLKEAVQDLNFGRRYENVLGALLSLCGKGQREELEKQTRLVQLLAVVAKRVRQASGSARQIVLQEGMDKVQSFFLKNNCRLPLNPSLVAKELNIKACSFFNSNAVPLKIALVNADPLGEEINVMFKEKEQELEQLTKELRQVNLQQFIQQTGTKVTVLPAESTEEEPALLELGNESTAQTNSLKRPSSSRQLPSNLRILQNPLSSGFNPEGIYV
ncbi:Phosphatidylinositol 4-phosphate 3-kinase C2 domain-containing subunit alpha [Acipenser ruthenus]|uniref:Phosphatidylinositol 4-phosphate 3-kinase C2 domain-containing subunit alpha n=1 Tax=Acipenser ruthenus TaxID=7906 RepID=A0A444UDY7_ACIRT|nr:Phosphatidylinositol 4-phosphate 3-kinase C2 domain-containing subunit alpha [Acipenser ruthenus]